MTSIGQQRRPARLGAAIDKALSPVRGVVRAYPMALSAVLAATCAAHAAGAFANTYMVNTAGDPGPGGTLSLRQAVAAANASSGNTVEFDTALSGSTITLTSGEIPIYQSMTIAMPGQNRLTISGNDTSSIFSIYPFVHKVPVIISGFTLTHGKSGLGGAIFAGQVSLRLYNTTIKASSADGGGAIYVKASYVIIGNSRIEGNHAIIGGGLNFYGCPNVHISDTTISGNTADYRGGGIYGSGVDRFELQGSTISGNVVPQPSGAGSGVRGGGGIMLKDISTYSHFTNSTITQNYAYTGGGGVALLDTFTSFGASFYQTTIAGNSAQIDETGIGITALGGGKPLISASIVANNFSQSSTDDLAGSFAANNSLIKSPGAATVSGTGCLIGVDPQLGPLADNGGTTLTLLPSAASPVIDKAPCGSTCTIDQRGAPRSHPNADMGAVERQLPEQLIFRNGFDPN